MAHAQLKAFLQNVRELAAASTLASQSDGTLLRSFVSTNDQTAFTALVKRYGSMVLGVSRRVLHDLGEAEDVFQATFLLLARKAGSLCNRESLAGWLHETSYRVSQSARRATVRRRQHEQRVKSMRVETPEWEVVWREVQTVLDEEIQRLPAIYRDVLVLCCLENQSGSEVAQKLGIKEGTVKSRLSKARARLQAALARRGVSLSAVLAATALVGNTASAIVPRSLVASTVQAAAVAATEKSLTSLALLARVSEGVIHLVQGVSKPMLLGKIKTIVLLAFCIGSIGLAAVGLSNGASQLIPGQIGRDKPTEPKEEAIAAKTPELRPDGERAKRQEAVHETDLDVTVNGRVVDPDGKPLAGAEVTLWCHLGYWAAYRAWHPETAGPLRPRSLATTGEDGRFTATFRKSDVTENPLNMFERSWRLVQVVAAAKGYGPAWASLDDKNNEKELTFRLAKDDGAVKGRVLDLEGQPVVGAGIRVVRVGNDSISSLWQPSWAGLSADCTTDPDGRFVLSGVGRGREVLLSIEGDRIENKLVRATTPTVGVGPEVEVVAKPSKPVEGTVRVKGAGKPLAGVVVYGEEERHHRRVRAVTDAQGHYRLVGLSKAATYQINFYPSLETGCLGRSVRVADTEGLRPVTVDVEVRRGVEVHCRLIDKVTRQPVRAELRYTPLEVNPLFGEALESGGYRPSREFQRSRVPGPDGVFRFVAYPGPGLLVVILQGHMGGYLPRPLAPADVAKARGDFHMEYARMFGIYRLIDPKDADKPLAVDIELDPGRKATGSLFGPDGKPISGATAYGLNRHFLMRGYNRLDVPGERLKADTFTASVLDPQRPRTVSFVHKERKLVGHVVLRGDEKGPVTVRMEPWGVLTGRLVDGDGKPVAGVRLGWRYPSVTAPGLPPPAEPFATDTEGRFRVEGLAPGVKFEITLSSGAKKGTAFSAGKALTGLSLEPGQTRDLGDIRVTATPAPKKAEGGNDD